jgi:hypothetical protein
METKNLYKLALADDTVRSILTAQTNHQQATEELNARNYDFARTTVRRAREKLGVISPESTFLRSVEESEETRPVPMPQFSYGGPVPSENNRSESILPVPENKDAEVYVVLPDFQCDLQDDSFLWRALDLVEDVQPVGIVHVGDENDATSISRWTKDTPDEHVPDQLQKQVDVTYQWMKRFRSVPSVEKMQVCYSNHGMRFGVSLRSRVPGWKDMRVVQYEHIMREAAWHHGDEPLDIDWDVHLVEMIPGTVAGHGDQWNLTSKSQYGQMTDTARDLGRNLIAGHTHRPLLSTVSFRDENGVQQNRFIANVGHAMDVTQAEYTQHYRGKTPSWGQAVLVVTVIDGVALPELVQDHFGTMLYNGKIY